MIEMMVWWNSLSNIEQIFACVAIPSTVLLLLQTILLLFSFGGDNSADSHGGDAHGLDSGHDVHDGHDFDSGHDVHDGHDFDSGHDVHGEHDVHDGYAHSHHAHDSGLRIFTVRGFIAFFCIFGWAGLVFLRSGMPTLASVPIATMLGFISMALIAYIMAQFLKLQANGAADVRTAIGVTGTVYIPIPPKRNGVGKVSAVVSGRYSEYDAVTDEDKTLKTNTAVTIVGITGGNTLVVIKK